MTAADENRSRIRLATQSDDTKTVLVEKPRKYWQGSTLLQAVNVCDKFFNCAYVKFQLEEELMEEMKKPTDNPVERLFMRMESGVEVEVYRQFLFEENGLEPFEDPTYHPKPDRREGAAERPQEGEARTSQERNE